MAAPTVVSRQTGEDASAQTSRSVTFGSTAAANNLILIVIAIKSNSGVMDTGFDTGYTELFDRIGPGGAVSSSLAVGYKVATGGETSTTVTSSGTARQADWVSFIMSGGTTWDIQVSSQTTGFGGSGANSVGIPNHTPTGGSIERLWLACAGWDSQGFGQTCTAAPTNYSNLQTSITTSTGAGFATAERVLTASSEDANGFTLSADADWQGQMVSISVTGVEAPTAGGFGFIRLGRHRGRFPSRENGFF